MILGDSFTDFVIKMLLIVYAHQTFRAMDSAKWSKDPEWLVFWMIFGVQQFLEIITDPLLGSFLPFYYELKLLFIVYLGLLGGASQIYNIFARTAFKQADMQVETLLKNPQVKPKFDMLTAQIANVRGMIVKKAN